MNYRLTAVAATIAASLALAGCPELSPSLDATGEYGGDFEVGMGDLQLIDGCEIRMSLDQNASGLPIMNAKVEGVVTLSFLCVVPEDLAELALGSGEMLGGALGLLGNSGIDSTGGNPLDIPPIAVSGALLPDGTLELTTPEILAGCPDNDCVTLAMIGSAEDWDGDGMMDSYEGTFAGSLKRNDVGLPLIGTFGVYSSSAQ